MNTFKTQIWGWCRYHDVNPVLTSPLADDITTVPSDPVVHDMGGGGDGGGGGRNY